MPTATAAEPLVPPGALERRRAPLDEVELRDDGGSLKFIGHAAVFDRWSEDLGGFRERIKRGAFSKVLKRDPDVVMLVDHGGLPLARTSVRSGPGLLDLSEDGRGLRAYAEFAPITLASDIRTLIDRRVLTQMSFGFTMRGGKEQWEEDEDGSSRRTILEFGELFDISIVTFAAYPQTDASMRSLACGIEIVDTQGDVREEVLRELALKIHRGELAPSVEERAAVDAAFARIGSVSPWWLELSLRSVSQEPEWSAAITREGETTKESDESSGEPVAYRLAARKRRLRALAPSSKGTT